MWFYTRLSPTKPSKKLTLDSCNTIYPKLHGWFWIRFNYWEGCPIWCLIIGLGADDRGVDESTCEGVTPFFWRAHVLTT